LLETISVIIPSYNSCKFIADLGWRVGEFVDWYIRAKELNLKTLLLKEVVLKRRIHGDNLGIRERQSASDYALILRAALDRRKTVVAD
jgi:hypothetical protein